MSKTTIRKINIQSLIQAKKSLETALLEKTTNEYIRDATIQRFEYTFELTWKTLKRFLKQQGVLVASPKETLRAAFQEQWIQNLENWFELLEARNETVHTYNHAKADEVYEVAKKFPPLLNALLIKISNLKE